jgi:hypothetical protein
MSGIPATSNKVASVSAPVLSRAGIAHRFKGEASRGVEDYCRQKILGGGTPRERMKPATFRISL